MPPRARALSPSRTSALIAFRALNRKCGSNCARRASMRCCSSARRRLSMSVWLRCQASSRSWPGASSGSPGWRRRCRWSRTSRPAASSSAAGARRRPGWRRAGSRAARPCRSIGPAGTRAPGRRTADHVARAFDQGRPARQRQAQARAQDDQRHRILDEPGHQQGRIVAVDADAQVVAVGLQGAEHADRRPQQHGEGDGRAGRDGGARRPRRCVES
jgi:hypothetical protein